MTNNLPTLAPQNMTEAMEFSKMLSQSQMVPKNYQRQPQDILVALQWGYEVGLQPLQALQNIAVINGKPSIYGDAALALVKNHPNCRGVSETIEGEGDKRVAVCTVKRAYGSEIEETKKTFSIQDAKTARLWGKQGPWQQYPERMLAMRARGFAIRDAFPDALKGIITQEEAEDIPTEPVNITPPVNNLDKLGPVETEADEEVVQSTEVEQELVPEAPEPQETAFSFQLLNTKGEPAPGHEQTQDPEVFCNQFMAMVTRGSASENDARGNPINERDRMSLIKQLKEANQGNIDNIPDELKKIAADHYIKELKKLGAKANAK